MSGGSEAVCLTRRCNQKCLFCCRGKNGRVHGDAAIRRALARRPSLLKFDEGEPMLSDRLLGWVRQARAAGVAEIVVPTNGSLLGRAALVRDLLEAGVAHFDVNFPSHEAAVYDRLTGTRGQLARRVRDLLAVSRLAGRPAVRLTMVLTSENCRSAEAYARFCCERLDGIRLVQFSLVRVVGEVRRRPWLVPRLEDFTPALRRGAALLEARGLHPAVDGIPLCHLEGVEHASINARQLAQGDGEGSRDKARTRRCAGCTLAGLCAGPRRDYVARHGDAALRPSARDPGPLRRRLAAGPIQWDGRRGVA